MKTIIEEIEVRSILTKTGIPGRKYCINPYVGCAHACKYCYATFIKRFTPLERKPSSLWQGLKPHPNFLTGFTGHIEPWGSFVDVKINAHEVLRRQLKRSQKGAIIISSVTDPYQPIEAKYMITRKCLKASLPYHFPIDILTKSSLVLRDIDIISKLKDTEVGITITTDNDKIRKIFEPNAPSISVRIETLKKLYKEGIKTYVFIGPALPMNPESLAKQVNPYVHKILIDRMNYIAKVKWLYKKHGIEKWLAEEFIDKIISRLRKSFSDKEVEVC